MRSAHKGFSFSALSFVFLFSLLFVFSWLLFFSFRINKKYKEVHNFITIADKCANASQVIKDVSSSLSEKAAYYVMTHDQKYMESYVQERFAFAIRDRAMNVLLELTKETDVVPQRLQSAILQADNLSELEMYAMRLAFEASDNKKVPVQIAHIEIRPNDFSTDPAELDGIARKIIFSEGYARAKERVNKNCGMIITELDASLQSVLREKNHQLKLYLNIYNSLLGILVIFFIIFFANLFLNVLAPLKSYIHSIKKKEQLKVWGAKELQYLADTYNNVHSYDPLTKILNRRAFTEMCAKVEENHQKVGFMLIDLDDFKHVNDTYGHVKGDYVLQIVAALLAGELSRNDYIARIGGDEFAVLLTDYNSETPGEYQRKIDDINIELNILDGFEDLSISAGLAFSENGYTKRLYENADKALYRIKANGKKGLSIWDEVIIYPE